MKTPITRNAGESTNVPVPERIGSYRIIDVAGRGGMGVVYKAVQDSLDRVVALKVLNVDAFRSQRHIDRFKREVRAAAKLHHTNIVPVFEFGEADESKKGDEARKGTQLIVSASSAFPCLAECVSVSGAQTLESGIDQIHMGSLSSRIFELL